LSGVLPLGERAWRVDLGADIDRAAIVPALLSLPGVIDVAVAEEHAAIFLRPGARLPDVRAALAARRPAGSTVRWRLRVRYDGPDLGAVAAWAGMSAGEVIAAHAAPAYEVKFIGFIAGFAYLGDVDPRLAAPRRSSPRAVVPPRAVGIAGARTGVYPREVSGGWNLVGTCLDPLPDWEPGHLVHLEPG
jgi:UPF0271 protein